MSRGGQNCPWLITTSLKWDLRDCVFQGVIHFIYLVKYRHKVIIFPYYPFIESIVMLPISLLMFIICVFFFLVSLTRILSILLIFFRKQPLIYFLYSSSVFNFIDFCYLYHFLLSAYFQFNMLFFFSYLG